MAGKSQKTAGFEAAMAELEQIVSDMEAGKLSLEDSLAAYKRGAELLTFLSSSSKRAAGRRWSVVPSPLTVSSFDSVPASSAMRVFFIFQTVLSIRNPNPS